MRNSSLFSIWIVFSRLARGPPWYANTYVNRKGFECSVKMRISHLFVKFHCWLAQQHRPAQHKKNPFVRQWGARICNGHLSRSCLFVIRLFCVSLPRCNDAFSIFPTLWTFEIRLPHVFTDVFFRLLDFRVMNAMEREEFRIKAKSSWNGGKNWNWERQKSIGDCHPPADRKRQWLRARAQFWNFLLV